MTFTEDTQILLEVGRKLFLEDRYICMYLIKPLNLKN